MHRADLVRQRTRIKNQVYAILARNLAPTPPVSDLFGRTGRHWLSRQEPPPDERSTVAALLRQLDFHGSELAVVDKELAVVALTDPMVARLMTIPGVDPIAGTCIVAAVGDFTRFDDPNKLVSYVGLNPRVRQSGNSAPVHGRISKTGRAHVRGVLVEDVDLGPGQGDGRPPRPHQRAGDAGVLLREGQPVAARQQPKHEARCATASPRAPTCGNTRPKICLQ